MFETKSVIRGLFLLLIIGSSFVIAQQKNKEMQDSGHLMKIPLTGAAEVPSPGDPDGSGTVNITLQQGQGRICFEVNVNNIETPTAAHLHKAATGQAGPPVITLIEKNGSWNSCVAADAALIKDIVQNPANYYFNIHNAQYPNGALRGQLSTHTKSQ